MDSNNSKQIVILVVVVLVVVIAAVVLLSGGSSSSELTPSEAISRLESSTCPYSQSEEGVSVSISGDVLTMTKEGCTGSCAINEKSGNIDITADCGSTPTPTQDLTKSEATSAMVACGCWYDLSDPDESIAQEGNQWIISKSGCGGKCWVNLDGSGCGHDVNEMCTGLTPGLTQQECIDKMKSGGCFYNYGDTGVSVTWSADQYVMQKTGCNGQCTCNKNTGYVHVDAGGPACKEGPLTRSQAVSKMEAAGCPFDPSDSDVDVYRSGDYYIMKEENCQEQCKINVNTGDTQIPGDPQCKMSKSTAVRRLEDNGCPFDAGSSKSHTRYDGDDLVITHDSCKGECRINLYSGKTHITKADCTIDQDEADRRMVNCGCWYDPSASDVSTKKKSNQWVMTKENCGGKCWIDTDAYNCGHDSNEMCTMPDPPEPTDKEKAIEMMKNCGCSYSMTGSDSTVSKKSCPTEAKLLGGECWVAESTSSTCSGVCWVSTDLSSSTCGHSSCGACCL